MEFEVNNAIAVLERTPLLLTIYLKDLSSNWTSSNEGENTWSAFDVLGHLIQGEKADWIARAQIILSDQKNKTFEPFNRFAQFEISKGKTMNQLLDEFESLRMANLTQLKSMPINTETLQKEGIHPELGKVTLKQLLATWVTHDLGHIAQIARIMAKQYKTEVGPWLAYIPILQR